MFRWYKVNTRHIIRSGSINIVCVLCLATLCRQNVSCRTVNVSSLSVIRGYACIMITLTLLIIGLTIYWHFSAIHIKTETKHNNGSLNALWEYSNTNCLQQFKLNTKLFNFHSWILNISGWIIADFWKLFTKM